MATAWGLCLKLGFIDGVNCTRGPSNWLLDNIESLVKGWDSSNARANNPDYVYDINRMTDVYLYRYAGDAVWGKTLSNGYYNLVEWPKDHVKYVRIHSHNITSNI